MNIEQKIGEQLNRPSDWNSQDESDRNFGSFK